MVINHLYKKRYLLAIYDMEDFLVTVCENVQDFAIYFNKKVHDAHSIVSRQFLNIRQGFIYDGPFGKEKLKIIFVEDDISIANTIDNITTKGKYNEDHSRCN